MLTLKPFGITAFFLLIAFAVPQATFSQQRYSPDKPHRDALPGRLVLKLAPQTGGISDARLQKGLSSIQATVVNKKFPKAEKPRDKPGWVDLTEIYEVEFSAAISPEKAAAAVEATRAVLYAEPLYHHRTMYEPNDPLAEQTSGPQYHLRKIRAYEAWDVEKGDSNVVIGIVDSGIKYDHPDLMGTLKYNYADPINGLDDDGDGYIDNFRGWDFSQDDNNATTPTNLAHGVLVTGVVSAHTDNGTGIAGTGFNCKYLPLKVYPDAAGTGVFTGWEAVVYAADHGAKVINLSWGNSTPASAFEQDVVNYATLNKDAVIIAAGGNTHSELDFHPSSYDNVLSVVGTDSLKVLSPSQTFSRKIDICAPGVNILTTQRTGTMYGYFGGSSFAAPQVAGAAALVRSKWPMLTAQQVAEQVRITADQSIYSLPGNQAYPEMIGRGFLDMYAALTDTLSASVRNISKNIDDQQPIYSGDTVILTGEFKNFLRPINGVTVTLTSASPYVTIIDNTAQLASLATLATVNNLADPFSFIVDPAAPANQVIRFRFGFAGQGYSDYQHFDIVVNPDYITLNANQLDVTLSARGTIGYNGRFTAQGVGVSYQNGPSLLYEAGLIVGSSTTRVSDVVRSQPLKTNQHFLRTEAMHFIQGNQATQQATGLMQDTASNSHRAGVEIRTNGYATAQAPHDKYVIVEYLIKNVTADTIKNLYAGIFADWDLNMSSQNAADWDGTRNLGYVYSHSPGQPYAGISLLSDHVPSYMALNNYSSSGTVIIGDSFSVAEKYVAISSGILSSQAGVSNPTDVSHIIGAKIGSLAPNQTDTVAFAILAGDNLPDLEQSADAAINNYPPVLAATHPIVQAATALVLYPNPAADEVRLSLAENAGEITIVVTNPLGQTLMQRKTNATGAVSFSTAMLPEGVYMIQVNTGKAVSTGKLVIKR